MSTRADDGPGAPGPPDVLVVDNYDSFTYNLVEYLSAHANCEVVTNQATIADVTSHDPDAVVISPGPGHPKNDRDVGVTMDVLREVTPTVPTLGVCLGLEAAVHAFGGHVGHAPEPVHGKATTVDHDATGVFNGLPQGFQAGRYHSLMATSVPECFEVSATATVAENAADEDADSLVMGIRHRSYPLECVQFHPESVLTPAGHDIVENFLALVDDR